MVNDVDRDRNAVYVLTDADSHKDVAAAVSGGRPDLGGNAKVRM